MKKISLTLFIIFFVSMLLANPADDIADWVAKQTCEFNAEDVVTFMELSTERNLSYGSEYIFNPSITYNLSVAVLDETHFVVSYSDIANSWAGTALIGTITGNSITYSSEYVFSPVGSNCISVAVLDATHFVIAFRGANSYGTTVIGTVNNNTISYGSEYIFNDTLTSEITIAVLDEANFVVSYRGNIGYGTAIIGTINDNTISFGTETVFNSAGTYDFSVAVLDETHFIASYCDSGNSNYGTAVIGTVSDNSISYSSEYVFSSASTYFLSITALDATRFVVSYYKGAYSYCGTATIGTVSGNAISFGDEYFFNSDYTNDIASATLDENQFVVTFCDYVNPQYGTAIIGTVNGNTISFGDEYFFNSDYTCHISTAAFDEDQFVITFCDYGNFQYGTAIIGEVEETSSLEHDILPTKIKLSNFPNPFNPETTIFFSIPEKSKVELNIFNTKGQKVKTLAQKEFMRGTHSFIWKGDDKFGKPVSSGIYYYNLIVDSKTKAVKKCLLLK